MTLTLKPITPNDPCYCGSGQKLKKCCKGTGYWTAPNIVTTTAVKSRPGNMRMLEIAVEAGVKVAPYMNERKILDAMPRQACIEALLELSSISLFARIYERTGYIIDTTTIAWLFRYGQVPFLESIHHQEDGISVAAMQEIAVAATMWVWSECGRDDLPPSIARVDLLDCPGTTTSLAGRDIDQKGTATLVACLRRSNSPSVINEWLVCRAIHVLFLSLFGEPVCDGPADVIGRLGCACARCMTVPHGAKCNCNLCGMLKATRFDLVDKESRTIRVKV